MQRIKERENQLAEREKAVLELEQLARVAHERLTQLAEEEVTRRWRELEEVSTVFARQILHELNYQRMQKESQQLSDTLKEKCRENKRLHNSFDSVKHANNSLRKQVCILKNMIIVTIHTHTSLRQFNRKIRNWRWRLIVSRPG